jgi:hypothetical protein
MASASSRRAMRPELGGAELRELDARGAVQRETHHATARSAAAANLDSVPIQPPA